MEVPAAAPATPSVAQISLDQALACLYALAVSALDVQRCSLYLRMGNGTSLRLHSDTGHLSGGHATISTEGTVAGLVMRTQVPLLVRDVAACPTLPTHADRYATPSFVSVPIVVESESAGVLNATERRDGQPFSERDLHIAEMVSCAMGATLHSHALARRVLDDGEIDPVTGLYNRRHLEKRLAQEVALAQRMGAPLSLLLLRLDAYAGIATHVSAQAAGVLMRTVAEMVGHIIRRSDLLVRYGVDELAVLLPGTPPRRARRVAAEIARDVVLDRLPEDLRYDCERLDLSLGLGCLGVPATGADLMRQAEEALRTARAQGGTAVVAADDEPGELSRLLPSAAESDAVASALNMGMPYLADPLSAMAQPAMDLVPQELARMYACLPIGFEDGILTLAMAHPGDSRAIHAISLFTGLAVCPVASSPDRIRQAISALSRGDAQACCAPANPA